MWGKSNVHDGIQNQKCIMIPHTLKCTGKNEWKKYAKMLTKLISEWQDNVYSSFSIFYCISPLTQGIGCLGGILHS